MSESTVSDIADPPRVDDEREQLLAVLDWFREAVLRKAAGLDEAASHTRPDGRLVSVAGLVRHLTRVEWRWIDGHLGGQTVERSEDEFSADGFVLSELVPAYRARGAATDAAVRARTFDTELRWVLLHLITETARHAGHADATRELIDGTVGE